MRWKRIEISGFKTDYEVSDSGHVRKYDTKEAVGLSIRGGYYRVRLKILLNGVAFYKDVSVHDLVAKAFIPNPDNKPVVNHINGIKNDNRVENLEWVSQQENVVHWVNVLKGKDRLNQRLGRNNASMIDNETAKVICECISDGETNAQIAAKFGVTTGLVEAIRARNNWVDISKDYVFPKKRGDRIDEELINSIVEELVIGDMPSFAYIGNKYGVDKDVVRKIFYRQRHRKYTKGILFNPKYFDDAGLIVTALECALRMEDYNTNESFLSLDTDVQRHRFIESYEWWKKRFKLWRQSKGMQY